MKDNKKDIEYQIVKSEVCGHTIQYKMIKKKYGLEKARIDEGKSAKEKKKARAERNDPYNTKSGEWKQNVKGSRQYPDPKKQGSKDASSRLSYKHNLQAKHGKKPSKEDLEYPMAASEKECNCKDCDCDKKEMNKREKFYIQKIQELRKAVDYSKHMSPKQGPNNQYNQLKSFSEQRGVEPRELMTDPKTGQFYDPGAARRLGQKIKEGFENFAAPPVERSNLARERMARRFDINEQSSTTPSVLNQNTGKTPAIQTTPEATKNVSNLLGNKQPEAQAEPMMSMPGQAPATAAPATAAPATAQASKTPYDIKNPYKIESAKNFGDAFNQARSKIGAGGVFEYGGKKYHTYTQDEFKNPEKNNIDVNNDQFYKDWQARKDTTGPNAYYANKMNPAPAAKQTPDQNMIPKDQA